jgi:hypothetical protein
LADELEIGFPPGMAVFAAREGAIVSRSFANIFFNMTIEAGQPLRNVWLCNYHMPASTVRTPLKFQISPIQSV